MDANFGFLAQAKPATLHKLLENMPLEDIAIVLAGLPTTLGIQVMAYFPERFQTGLIPALREARQAAPDRIEKTVGKIRETLISAKQAKEARQAPAPPPPHQTQQGKLARQAYQAQPKPSAKTPQDPQTLAERHGGDSPFGKPQPWTPRSAQSSPINGPALPGKPKPVAGDPLQSPLARAGLLDLIGRAQVKLLPKSGAARKPPAAPARPAAKAPGAKPGPGRPAAREGVLRSVKVSGAPRVIGPRGAAPAVPVDAESPGSGARRMDGKVILAAILREADAGVRDNVRSVDPALFKDLQNRMFYFDDLMLTGDNALAQVFTASPAAESALALRFAAPALRDRVLRVVSPGRAEALRDNGRAARASLDDVEAAQKKVLDVALRLQAAGRILIDPRDPDLAGS